MIGRNHAVIIGSDLSAREVRRFRPHDAAEPPWQGLAKASAPFTLLRRPSIPAAPRAMSLWFFESVCATHHAGPADNT